jgi:ribosome production factor 1
VDFHGDAALTLPSYAFRTTEKVALQEIGPRFTLKLRSLKKGVPAVTSVGLTVKPLTISLEEPKQGEKDATSLSTDYEPKEDGFLWRWKVCRLSPDRADLTHLYIVA